MAWTIEIDKAAKKELAKLDKSAAERILRFLEERIATDENPRRFGEALAENLAAFGNIASEIIASSWRYKTP